MKRYLVYIILSVCLVLLILAELLKPREISWEAGFSSKGKMPYDTWVLFNQLDEIFPARTVLKNFENYYEAFFTGDRYGKTWIIVTDNFAPDEYSIKSLLNYIDNGHQVFISAFDFNLNLLDSLGLETRSHFQTQTSEIRFDLEHRKLRSDTGYFYNYRFYTYFLDTLPKNCQVLGRYASGEINFVRLFIGKGELYLNTVPLAYTNYNLLLEKSRGFAERSLSYLQINDIIWDEYTRYGSQFSGSPLRYVLSVKGLRYGIYLGLILIFIYLILGTKRKQKMIPIIDPLQNNTFYFIDTISRLYLNKGKHNDIAEKRIQFFKEFIRVRYHMEPGDYQDDFVKRFAAKSKSNPERVKRLFENLKRIEKQANITDRDLIDLNREIDYFKNK